MSLCTIRSAGRRRIGGGALAAGAALWLASAAPGQPTGVIIDQPDFYLYQTAEVPGEAGEVAFDPTDSNRPYIVIDGGTAGGGGVYRGEWVNGIVVATDQLVSLDNPSGVCFSTDGDLYIIQDFTAALRVVYAPRNGPPYTVQQLIANNNFGPSTADDDPIAIATAPPGFDGVNVDPGDIVIVDRGLEANGPVEVLVYTPGFVAPGGPAATLYNRRLASTYQYGAYNNIEMNDLTFALDGSSMFTILQNGKVLEVNPDGVLVRELPITGVTFSTLQALGTNPNDGRLWIADDTLDEVWSVPPTGGEARRELKFTRSGAVPPATANFHFPGLQFSNDGQYFTVADTITPGHIHLFKKRLPGNNPPTARIIPTPANQIAPPSGGVATITLDGSTSDDGDGGTQGLTYQWYYLGTRPGVVILNPASAVTSVNIPNLTGTFLFALKVNDGQAENNVMISEVMFAVPAEATIEIPLGSYFKSGQSLFMARTPGDIVFDTGDSDRLYVVNDDTVANGGGVYRIDMSLDGSYAVGERVLALDGISSIAMTADGVLYWLRDGAGSAASPYFGKLATPRNGPPYVSTGLISNFANTADDDPFCMRVVPAGFAGPNVQPGDVLIGDAGADADANNAIYVYRPPNPPANPTAYTTLFMDTATLAAINSSARNNLNDMEFSADGTRLYLAFDDGKIVAVDSSGAVTNTFLPTGVAFNNVEGIGVNPVDGRIFVADDDLDQIWSFDPNAPDGIGGQARKEVQFRLPGESRPNFQINFHDPTLTFSPDGKRLVVTDTGLDAVTADGWIWVLSVDAPPPMFPDYDSDNDVDVFDMIAFSTCAYGARITINDPACASADLDHDGDGDQADFAVMQRCFSGMNVPWTPICKN
ncbi:MAG: hypothetical protein HRF43_13220 [Phycisphaerae bacterium]|jgi:hypothetical protein